LDIDFIFKNFKDKSVQILKSLDNNDKNGKDCNITQMEQNNTINFAAHYFLLSTMHMYIYSQMVCPLGLAWVVKGEIVILFTQVQSHL